MPVKRRRPKVRGVLPEWLVSAVEAALRGEPLPADCNPFLRLDIASARREDLERLLREPLPRQPGEPWHGYLLRCGIVRRGKVGR